MEAETIGQRKEDRAMAADKGQTKKNGQSSQMAAMRQVLRYIRRYWLMVGFSLADRKSVV